MFNHPAAWAGFGAFVFAMLALDLGVFHRKAKVVRFREALIWVCFWVGLAGIFAVWVYYDRGVDDALSFVTGYLIEQSLSVDNLFVFLLIFQTLKTPPQYQHRILFWGIVGAFALRAIFIFTGVAVVQFFHWTIYVFGAFLVYTGGKLAFATDEEEVEMENNRVLKLLRRWFPVTHEDGGGKFLLRIDGRLHATPLMIAMLLLNIMDVIFAADSIPAILAISQDPFIVYTSNTFAILGLRSMFFMLSGIMDLFRFLKYGLSIVLVFVGAKMLGSAWFEIPILLSLGIVMGILAFSILASVLPVFRRVEEGPPTGAPDRRDF